MDRPLKIVLLIAILVSMAVACTREARVIPRRKMQRIYREMLLADQWLDANYGLREQADTMWFYEPIFEKYGYTVADYRKSVEHYLYDPDRYVAMLEAVSKSLKLDAERLNREIMAEQRFKQMLDSLSRGIDFASTYVPYQDLFTAPVMQDRIRIVRDEKGFYLPEKVVEDTLFHGPALIIKEKEP